MRFTKIICTLGPATADAQGILTLAKAGMNVARINFSHGDREKHRQTFRLIRSVNEKHDFSIATLLDTKGSEIRTGDVRSPMKIRKGATVVFSPVDLPKEKYPVIKVSYDGFAHDARNAEKILVDNGEMAFALKDIRRGGIVVAKALDDGEIGSRRHINLPGADIALPSITTSDWKDLKVGVEEQADYVALSFIRTVKDVHDVRAFLRRHNSDMGIIAKIETRRAVEDLDAIIEASDAVMVARGDLGAEMPFEQIPAIQDHIVARCRVAGKPVIVATHMLESMIQHPMPTRAEATDVAHAAWTQADATMLSAETAVGKYPVLSLDSMARILVETEAHVRRTPPADIGIAGDREARGEAATEMAASSGAHAILAITATGATAKAISKFRPHVPIFAFTNSPAVQRSLQLSFGVHAFALSFQKDPDRTLRAALRYCAKEKLLRSGQRVVVVSDAPARGAPVSSLQIRTVGSSR